MKGRLGLEWLLFLLLSILIPAWVMAQTPYVRSGKCVTCHKAIYETWKDTLHNKSQQILSRTNDTVVVDWKGMLKLKAGNIDFRIIRPRLSLEMFEKDPKNVVPNSCNGCHTEWGKDRVGYEAGVRAYESLFGM